VQANSNFISNRFAILNESFRQGSQEATANFTYDMRKMNCNDSFFDPNQQGVITWEDMG